MTGVIWFVQVVHYPLFDGVGLEGFKAYELRHSNLTTFVVIVPMVIELLTAALLIWRRPAFITSWEIYLGLGLVIIIWLSTAFLQVPQHTTLALGFDASAHGFLVSSNWVRTAAWTLRTWLVCRWLYRLINMPL